VFEDNPTSEHALEQAAMTKMDHAARKTDSSNGPSTTPRDDPALVRPQCRHIDVRYGS